jgi:hypothetical protein
MDEQGLGGFGAGRGGVHGHGGRDAMLLQRLEEAEEETRRQMLGGVAFPGALGYGQQAGDGEEAAGLADSDAAGSEPEPALARPRGGSGSKRSRAAEEHNLSEKVPTLLFLISGVCLLLCSDFAARVLKVVARFVRRGGGAGSTIR